MAYETKPNTGSLFKNNYKESGDKRPDYTGTCVISGEEFRISAWINTSKNGTKYMSLSFQPGEKAQSPDFDSDVPFN